MWRKKYHGLIYWILVARNRGAQIPGAWSRGETKLRRMASNIVSIITAFHFLSIQKYRGPHTSRRKHRITVCFESHAKIVAPYYGTCLMSTFWQPEFGGGSQIFGKSVGCWYRTVTLTGRTWNLINNTDNLNKDNEKVRKSSQSMINKEATKYVKNLIMKIFRLDGLERCFKTGKHGW